MSDNNNFNRRDFLRGVTRSAAVGGLGISLIGDELHAEARPDDKPQGPPVKCAVIGLGTQGREILTSLAKLPNGPVAAICDNYTAPGYIKRAQTIVPQAAFMDDYRKVLDDKTVQAVIIATPSHKHKQIVLDALAAGKHVYCEAPLASSIEDAKAIAKAGLDAKTVFQAGLQIRANKQHRHVLGFMRAGALGKTIAGRAQWHKKTLWRLPSPTPERDRDLNWRLSKETSGGLLGEIGIHQIDTASWFLNMLPVAVSGYSSIVFYNDGRDVPDTAQCILEYPNGVRFAYDITIANSYDGIYEQFIGSETTFFMRDQRAWMFKEADAPLLGWEVYAKKEVQSIGEDASGTGIALVADATQLLAQGKEPAKVGTDVTKTALYQALDIFLTSIGTNTKPGADKDPSNPKKGKNPGAGPLEGYHATVVALKSNEAVLTGNKIAFTKEMFEL